MSIRRFLILCCLVVPCWLWRSAALAESPPPDPLRANASVGRTSSPSDVTIRAESADDGARLRIGTVTSLLALPEPTALTVETVQLAPDTRGALIRVRHTHGETATLIAKTARGISAIWTGRTDLHGDPGERTADAIEVIDWDGDGNPDVVVGTYDERVRLCGEARTLLDAYVVDAKSAKLRAAGPRHRAPPTTTWTAVEKAPVGVGPAPVVDGLRVTARSEAFLNLRWDLPSHPIRVLAITTNAQAGSAPFDLVLLGEREVAVAIHVPASTTASPRLWVTPSAPLTGACWSLALPPGAPAITEVLALTNIDFEGGLPALVGEVAKDGAHSTQASELLKYTGAEVFPAVAAAWPTAAERGKRRFVRELGPRAAHDAAAVALLAQALEDANAEVRKAALDVATATLPHSQTVLATAAAQANSTGDLAVERLAERGDVQAVTPMLLGLLATEQGPTRAAVRAGLLVAARRAGTPVAIQVEAWLQSRPSVAARAAVALALADPGSPVRDTARSVAAATLVEATEFPDRWRLVAALALLPGDAETDQWLAGVATGKDPWMLRAAALRALSSRASMRTHEVARALLHDEYPRVRADALAALRAAPDALELLTASARNDVWFSVRAASLDALAGGPAVEVAKHALKDRSDAVRTAAIRTLRRERSTASWPAVAAHVQDAEEFPRVIAEGIAFAKAFCLNEAGPALRGVVERGLKPDAWSPDVDLALEALGALSALGGEHARWAAAQALSPVVPEAFRQALQKAAATPTACVPGP